MKYKGNLSTKLPFLQNNENALTTVLHSTDDSICDFKKKIYNVTTIMIYLLAHVWQIVSG